MRQLLWNAPEDGSVPGLCWLLAGTCRGTCTSQYRESMTSRVCWICGELTLLVLWGPSLWHFVGGGVDGASDSDIADSDGGNGVCLYMMMLIMNLKPKCRLPYLGSATAATRAVLPIRTASTSGCSAAFVCQSNTPLVLGIFNVYTDIDACDCAWGLHEHWKRVSNKSGLGEKSLAFRRSWTYIGLCSFHLVLCRTCRKIYRETMTYDTVWHWQCLPKEIPAPLNSTFFMQALPFIIVHVCTSISPWPRIPLCQHHLGCICAVLGRS